MHHTLDKARFLQNYSNKSIRNIKKCDNNKVLTKVNKLKLRNKLNKLPCKLQTRPFKKKDMITKWLTFLLSQATVESENKNALMPL